MKGKNMNNNVTKILSHYIEDIKYEDLPLSVVDTAKKVFVDFLAVSIAGFYKGPLANVMFNKYSEMPGSSESTIIGSSFKTCAMNAALINGISGHSLDLDDGHREAKGHPGVAVIPAILALAEKKGANGKDFILSLVVGYEVFVRLGKIANPWLFDKGFHTTGVCGTLAAAAGTGKLLSLDSKGIESSIGIAGTQCSGLLAVTHTGQMIKPLNAGKAAQSGLLASLLAAKGVKGPENIIECEDGFLQAFSKKTDLVEKLVENWGKEFSIEQCYIKLYPSCRHTHAAIDAALNLNKRYSNQFDIQNIDSIEITTYPAALKLTKKENMPSDEAETRFNIGFAVCLALIEGKAGINEFTFKNIKNKKISELFKKVRVFEDSSFESKDCNIRGAKVRIKLKDSSLEYEEIVQLPKGEPESPVSMDDIKDKFYSCTKEYWDFLKINQIIDMIVNIENLTNITYLVDRIRG